MSEYEEMIVTDLRLLSFNDVRERLGIKEISCSQSGTTYLTSHNRIKAFGENISCNINALNEDLKTLSKSNKVDKNIGE